ncbi:MAG: TrmH family RNA methyltransferase [Bacteroidetes bacterium]|nr:MAG: TrmH family RNA methyltransferase [Bacteroidota bacterium]
MRKLKNSELDRKNIDEYKSAKKSPIIIVLDNIRSLNNIGSVFRTSDAFLVEAIYLCGITAKPPHKDIQKTALGATQSVDWEYFDTTKEAILKLKENNYQIVSIEQVEGSTSLNNFEVEKLKKYALVFGNEVKGVAQDIVDMSDECIEIPQYGTKHSFNISVSAGIVMWDFFSKLNNLSSPSAGDSVPALLHPIHR